MQAILISGGTGLVGNFLTNVLKSKGYEVRHLSRNANEAAATPTFEWNIDTKQIDIAAFEGVGHVVHLAGASIAQRWTPAYKKILHSSRIDSAKLLIEAIQKLPKGQIKTFSSASAMGIYGDSGTTLLTETAVPAQNFTSQLCVAWEQASQELEGLGIRRLVWRIPLVLQKGEGALQKMELPAKLGVGSYFGNGNQIYSWVHIQDLCNMFVFGIENPNLQGIFNANAPQTLSNKQFSKSLNQALHRPFIPAPAPLFLLKMVLGEFAESLYWSNNLSAEKIQNAGFKFSFPTLPQALDNIYGN